MGAREQFCYMIVLLYGGRIRQIFLEQIILLVFGVLCSSKLKILIYMNGLVMATLIVFANYKNVA